MTRCGVIGASALVLSLLSGPAAAIDADYVIHDGFYPTVAAFRYAALVFSNGDYGHLVFIFAAIGIAVGAIHAFFKNGRDPMAFAQWGVIFLIGAGVYQGMILSKGTVHVYDPVINRYEPVGDVPDIVILAASTTNMIEQVAVDIANTASPRLHEDVVNGTLFDVVHKATGVGRPISDEYLWRSLKFYYMDCVRVAAVVPANGISLNALKRTTVDLPSEFAKANKATLWTTFFQDGDPRSQTMSCQEAWNVHLSPALTDTSTYGAFAETVCAEAGFDPSEANELARCQQFMDETPGTVFDVAGGDRFTWFRAIALARAMYDAASDADPQAAIAADTSRQYFQSSLGFLSGAQEFGPFIRAGFLGAAIATVPAILLFIMTPFIGRVLQISLSFFVFVALWGVIDAGIAQIVHGLAVDAFTDVAANNLAFNAIVLQPPASVKALEVFGASRLIAIAFAAVISVHVFRLSGSSFASLTSSLGGRLEGFAGSAANRVIDPQTRTSFASGLSSAVGTSSAFAHAGDDAFAGFNEAAILSSARQSSQGSFLGGRGGVVGRTLGARDAGASYGEAIAVGGDASGAVTPHGEAGHAPTAHARGVESAYGNTTKTVTGGIAFTKTMERLASRTGEDVFDVASRIQGGHAGEMASRNAYAGHDPAVIEDMNVTEQAQRLAGVDALNSVAGENATTAYGLTRGARTMSSSYDAGAGRGAADPGQRAGMVEHGAQIRAGGIGSAQGNIAAGSAYGETGEGAAYASAKIGAERASHGALNLGALLDANNADRSQWLQGEQAQASVFVAPDGANYQSLSPHLNDSQRKIINDAGGAVATISQIEGSIGNLSVRASNGAHQDSRVTLDTSFVSDSSNRVSEGPKFDIGLEDQGQFIMASMHAGDAGADRLGLIGDFREDQWNRAAEGFSQRLSSITDVSRVVGESATAGVDAALFAQLTGGTPAISKAFGVSFQGGVRGSASTSNSVSEMNQASGRYWRNEIEQIRDDVFGPQSVIPESERGSEMQRRALDLEVQADDLLQQVVDRTNDPDLAPLGKKGVGLDGMSSEKGEGGRFDGVVGGSYEDALWHSQNPSSMRGAK